MRGSAAGLSEQLVPRKHATLFTRAVLLQIIALAAICLCFVTLALNARTNLANAGLAFGFSFLDQAAGFRIGETLIAYTPADSYARAMLVGFVNTLRVAALGCVFATVSGVFLGILRLSTNPLLARLSAAYVEAIRNTPLLLQLVLWHALILRLPSAREALHPLPGIYLSQRGLQVPSVGFTEDEWPILTAFVLACVLAWLNHRRLRAQRYQTGRAAPSWPQALSLIVALPLILSMLTGNTPTVTLSELRGFNFVGGLTLTPEYAALLFGLVVYTSAFIAEIVRSGIQSVDAGQWEAARAVGLRDGTIMRLVVMPQALRVIAPPLTSQYLNLMKNSSLAVVIGYPEFTSVTNTVLNQTGRSIEVLLILMIVYLTLSLVMSTAMNLFNARVILKERR